MTQSLTIPNNKENIKIHIRQHLRAVLKSVECPVEGCPEWASTLGILREHFMYRHCKLKVAIIQEGPEPLPRCDQFRMHIPRSRVCKNRQTDKCNKATER